MRANREFSHGGELPIAMSRAFFGNMQSANMFSAMSSEQQQMCIDGTFAPLVAANMQAYIDNLGDADNNISCFGDMILY